MRGNVTLHCKQRTVTLECQLAGVGVEGMERWSGASFAVFRGKRVTDDVTAARKRNNPVRLKKCSKAGGERDAVRRNTSEIKCDMRLRH